VPEILILINTHTHTILLTLPILSHLQSKQYNSAIKKSQSFLFSPDRRDKPCESRPVTKDGTGLASLGMMAGSMTAENA
jgi:hypothetical protein